MALFSKNKKNKKEKLSIDDFGSKDVPFTTKERAMRDAGIHPVRGRTQKSKNIARKIIVFSITIIVLFVFISSISGIFANNRVKDLESKLQQYESPAFKARYGSLGEEVIRSYFAQKSPPVNLMQTALWSFSRDNLAGFSSDEANPDGDSESAPVIVDNLALIDAYETEALISESELEAKENIGKFPKPINEILTYTGTIDGKQYKFTVNFLIPNADGVKTLPYLISPPAIMPMDTLIESDLDATKPNVVQEGGVFSDVKLNPSSIETINSWASAYTQDDSETLKRIAGDNDISHYYRGVGGFLLSGTPDVVWSYEYSDGDIRRIYTRIKFRMETSTSSESSNDNKFRPLQTIDLMLTNYSKGTPNIVAWGPGGTWRKLSPEGNAIKLSPEQQKEIYGDKNDPTTTQDPENDLNDSESLTPEVPGAPSLSPTSTTQTSEKKSETSSSRKKSTKKSSEKKNKRTTSRNKEK